MSSLAGAASPLREGTSPRSGGGRGEEIAATTSRPEAVIGLHFFSPANVMRLLEIVRGRRTAKEVIATSLQLAKRLGKVGVLVGNCRGFVGNRMFLPYIREAQFLV